MKRYELIAEELRQTLVRMPENSRLPGTRALMEQFNVSQATIDRSLAILVEDGTAVRQPGVGYFSASGRSPSVQRRRRIAFAFCYHRERMDNPLYGALIAGFLQRAGELNYELNVFACDEMAEIGNFRSRFNGEAPDCCVLLGCSKQSFLYALRDMKIPFVQLYPNIITENDPAVLIDNRAIIELLVGHLVKLGHRRIAMLHGQGFDNTHMFDQEERMEAFYQALQKYELPYSSRSMLYGGFDTEAGYQAAKRLLDTAPELRPSAIVANDYNAGGVYRAAAELGLRIPEDLSVTGIDNLPQCQSLSPLLTSVDIEWDVAIDLIVKLIENPDHPETVLRTPVKLIERASAGVTPAFCEATG